MRSNPVNAYMSLDNELERMHELLKLYMTLPQTQNTYASSNSTFSPSKTNMPEIYRRILEMQNVLLASVCSADKLIQEKVAELALTGSDQDNEALLLKK